ncbi:hypothetical protein B296_00038973 [Ensete ventricosum]|uniref:Uncharacterized protein n=1 Tax=Ensete ventricosum TaxID=4639 RepID=A0A426ZRP1_ENSVE|nr:hypothetical protein B296_00038973 [Ensete ventricosum]
MYRSVPVYQHRVRRCIPIARRRRKRKKIGRSDRGIEEEGGRGNKMKKWKKKKDEEKSFDSVLGKQQHQQLLNAYSKVPPKPKVSSKRYMLYCLKYSLFCNSDFEELEAVPTSSVIEGPLEPTTSSNATPIPDVPDDPFANFFSVRKTIIINLQNTVNIGNASNVTTVAVQPRVDAATIPVTPHGPFVNPSVVPTSQPTSVLPALSTLLVAPSDTLESSGGNSNRATNLVKPSFFCPSLSSSALVTPPVSSLTRTAPPVYPPVTMQHPYGTPLLQPFPPPTPSASLTPAPIFGPVITRDKVRDALLRLVQASFLFSFVTLVAFFIFLL